MKALAKKCVLCGKKTQDGYYRREAKKGARKQPLCSACFKAEAAKASFKTDASW